MAFQAEIVFVCSADHDGGGIRRGGRKNVLSFSFFPPPPHGLQRGLTLLLLTHCLTYDFESLVSLRSSIY